MAAGKTKLLVTQIRGVIGHPQTMRRTLKGLGLRGRHSSVIVDNTPSVRGMIKKIIHFVQVEDIDD